VPNGNGTKNGNAAGWKVLATIGGGLCSIALAFAVNTAKDAQIAIDIAAQHGAELNVIRGELASLRQEVVSRTHDRYTSRDAERDREYLLERVNRLERMVEQMLNHVSSEGDIK
jgi:hypothetical protein